MTFISLAPIIKVLFHTNPLKPSRTTCIRIPRYSLIINNNESVTFGRRAIMCRIFKMPFKSTHPYPL